MKGEGINFSQGICEESYPQGCICKGGDAPNGLEGWRSSLPGGKKMKEISGSGNQSKENKIRENMAHLGPCHTRGRAGSEAAWDRGDHSGP